MDVRRILQVMFVLGGAWLASCDRGKSDGETSAQEESGGGATLESACTDWCEKELQCHAEAMPVADCVVVCTGEGEGATAACLDAMTDWYLCRADLECNAAGCPEDGIDTYCSDAG